MERPTETRGGVAPATLGMLATQASATSAAHVRAVLRNRRRANVLIAAPARARLGLAANGTLVVMMIVKMLVLLLVMLLVLRRHVATDLEDDGDGR